jgi:hypothetical protein
MAWSVHIIREFVAQHGVFFWAGVQDLRLFIGVPFVLQLLSDPGEADCEEDRQGQDWDQCPQQPHHRPGALCDAPQRRQEGRRQEERRDRGQKLRVLGLRSICDIELELDQIVETCKTSDFRFDTALTRCAQRLTLLYSVERSIKLVKIIDSVFHVVPKQTFLVIGRNILLKLLKLFEGSNLEAKILFLWMVNSTRIGKPNNGYCYVPDCTTEKSARAFVLSEPSRAGLEIYCCSRSLPDVSSCR